MKQPIANLVIIMLCVLGLSSCKGGLCAATQAALTDSDSDCSEDSADNCPTEYNPDQFDGDADGVGYYCDLDDDDAYTAVELIHDPAQTLTDAGLGMATEDPAYLKPDLAVSAEKDFDIGDEGGAYFLVSCDGNFLGVISADATDDISLANPDGGFGNADSEYSIFNEYRHYGRTTTACSAFNLNAVAPPTLYYRELDSTADFFVGYFTLNDDLDFSIDSCSVLAEMGLTVGACD